MEETNSIPQNIGEVDALLSSIESSPRETEAAPVEQPAEVKTQAEVEYELSHRGIKTKYPVSKVLGFAQQGFDYNKKMHDLNVQRGLFDADRAKTADQSKKYADVEQRLQQYKDVEEYRKTDPNWWNHVLETYQQKRQEQGGNAPLMNNPVIEKLIQDEVAPLKEYITSQQEREKLLARANEDTELDGLVGSFKEENAQFDWSTLDNNGLDLEQRILKHANDMGLSKPNQFRAAARDFLHDESVKRAEVKAKEDLGKNIQKANKLGLGPVKNQPNDKITRVKDVRSKSWDEVGNEALKEMGL